MSAAPSCRPVQRLHSDKTFDFIACEVVLLAPATRVVVAGAQFLRLLAEGRSLLQIADTLGIGYKTAANNCRRSKAKIGAASAAELIRIAIRGGLVDCDAGLSERAVDSPPRPP
jgi:DNA-binding CsgD family transcriptional regulator